MTDYPKPFLKWAGGKDQLLPELTSAIPKPWIDAKRKRYHEPFLGAGALFLELWRLTGGKLVAFIGDANHELMDAWKGVLMVADEVAEYLDEWPSDARTYYRIRAMDPEEVELLAERAARTIYLNKNCFNGLYRLGPHFLDPTKRAFNVPWCKEPGRKAYEPENFEALSKVRAAWHWRDFWDCHRDVRKGDLVYFDPPYVPVKRTSKTDYGTGSFGYAEHEKLAELFDRLVDRGAHCLLSNADTPWVRDRYSSHAVHEVVANRAINRDGKKRTGAAEVIVVGSRE